ncbi:MAG TPA: hypothetical protein VFR41_09585 [Acidimicrobiia bacterium]|nr:hypothetical protein [Acidimicrobiia bacterium]
MAAGVTVAVKLAAGDDASGLACMLAALLEDNLRDFRGRSFVARHTRGDVVLLASDRDIAVTLSFQPGEIRVVEGAIADVPVVAGDWLALTKVCSGQRSPVAAVVARDLRVKPGRGLRAAAGAGFALSVPKSFYEEDRDALARRRHRAIVASAIVGTALAGVFFVAIRRRAR